MPSVLLVEDEDGIRLTVGDRLRSEGYRVREVSDGVSALELARSGNFDAIVLDLMLPGMPGLEVCRRLRDSGVRTPLLMLTALGQVTDTVTGLRSGADDYLTKPFAMSELMARIAALLRRSGDPVQSSRRTVYRFGNIRVDARQAAVFRDGRQLKLSVKEYLLLLYFVRHPRQVLTRQVLMKEVWKYRTELSTRTVDVHVGWLRQKVEENPKKPRWIVTRLGIGYIFDPE